MGNPGSRLDNKLENFPIIDTTAGHRKRHFVNVWLLNNLIILFCCVLVLKIGHPTTVNIHGVEICAVFGPIKQTIINMTYAASIF